MFLDFGSTRHNGMFLAHCCKVVSIDRKSWAAGKTCSPQWSSQFCSLPLCRVPPGLRVRDGCRLGNLKLKFILPYLQGRINLTNEFNWISSTFTTLGLSCGEEGAGGSYFEKPSNPEWINANFNHLDPEHLPGKRIRCRSSKAPK